MSVLRWTAETFGRRQATTYRATLLSALQALEGGPTILGAKSREDIGEGVRTLHVARGGRKGRHFILFRQSAPDTLDILRILHDSMDLAQHLPPDGHSHRDDG